jgi:ribosomal protein S27AE
MIENNYKRDSEAWKNWERVKESKDKSFRTHDKIRSFRYFTDCLYDLFEDSGDLFELKEDLILLLDELDDEEALLIIKDHIIAAMKEIDMDLIDKNVCPECGCRLYEEEIDSISEVLDCRGEKVTRTEIETRLTCGHCGWEEIK